MDVENTIITENPEIDGELSSSPDKKTNLWDYIVDFFSKPSSYLILAFIVPVFLMFLIYLSMKIHPFGDGSVLVLDLNGQYVYFFEALRSKVMEGSSLLYSFSRALGGEFMGIYAYYLASPLSYIVCLFPKNMILEALFTIFLLKTGICGLTFGYYLHKTSKKLNKYAVVMLSCMYALSSYCIIQQHNTMWIDCVMWLPLIALGIESLIKYGKYKLYLFTLALSVWSNFYIGYMLCIFCFVYFFCYYFATSDENNPLMEKVHFIKSLSRMAVWSLLAIGMTLVIILTTYYSLSFGKNDFSNPNFAPTSKLDFLDLLTKFFPGSYDTVRPEGLPFVYCGVLTLFLVPTYFISKKISDRKKIFAGIFIVFLVLSFALSTADLIWHGFQRPNWLNYRYSFMLCFFLVVLASRAFEHIDEIPSKVFVGTATVLTAFLFLIQKFDYEHMQDIDTIWLSLAFVGLTMIMLCLHRIKHNRETVAAIMAIFVCLELFCNGLSNCLDLHDDVYYSSYSSYNNYIANLTPAVERLKEEDPSFYRFEKTVHRKTNDNFALGIRGLSNSTSTLNAETIKFLKQMGYSSKSHWSKYLGGTPVTDSLLGIKYIISDKDLSHHHTAQFTEGKYTVYLNEHALSLAYGVTPQIVDVNMEDCDNPFDRVNGLISAMIGEPIQVYTPVELKGTSLVNMDESYIASHLKYTAVDKNREATLYYEFTAPLSGAEYYLYLPSDYPREMNVKVNGAGNGTFYGNETTRIVSVGASFDAGETIKIGLSLVKSDAYIKDEGHVLYYIDYSAYEYAMSRLKEVQYNIEGFTEDSFEGTIYTPIDTQTILTTIPYDEGWEIKVDGQEIEYFKTLDALITFVIPDPGEHSVTMRYLPDSYTTGMTGTIACCFILLFILVFEAIYKKKTGRPAPFLGGITPPNTENEPEQIPDCEGSLPIPPSEEENILPPFEDNGPDNQ